MLDDRPYMRQQSPFSGGRRWSATFTLLIVNAVIFFFQSIIEKYGTFQIDKYLYLSIEGLSNGYVWQLISFQFLHAGILHLLCNCIVIYFFGTALEEALGKLSFLKLYFLSGVLGGILQILVSWALSEKAQVMGASAGAFGLIAAFATMYPNKQLVFLLFFVIPINMRAKTLLWLVTAIGVMGAIMWQGSIAHIAHLGGLFTGIVYIKFLRDIKINFNWPPAGNRYARRERRSKREANQNSASSFWGGQGQTKSEELAPDEFISREVDPILDKISEHGIHSLTERERKILESARSKMAGK
jgi:membrane associated rhomboid family serine protease